MIGQRALLALALTAGALAGVLYYVGAQRTGIVVAARDLDATHALQSDDLSFAALPPDAIPAGALTDPSRAVGRVPRAPLWKGQILLGDALGDEAASFRTGIAVPPGMRAGALVDVLAVPIGGRAPAGRVTEIVAPAALVLDVRTETGAPYGALVPKGGITAVTERIGSVVIAIERADEVRFADRIATSTFILTLAGSR